MSSSFFISVKRKLFKLVVLPCLHTCRSKAAFTLGCGPWPGAGPAQVRVFTLHFADSHLSGLGSSGHGFPNRARRFGPGTGLIISAF